MYTTSVGICAILMNEQIKFDCLVRLLLHNDILDLVLFFLVQLSRLKDMVDQLLLQEEIRLVSSLLKQALQEHQRDTETLPLDLWKKSVCLTDSKS